jgi:hypothetical protein
MCLGVEQGPNTGLESPAHFLPDVQKLKRGRITNALAVDKLDSECLVIYPAASLLECTLSNSQFLSLGNRRCAVTILWIAGLPGDLYYCWVDSSLWHQNANGRISRQSAKWTKQTKIRSKLSDATHSCPSRQGMSDPTMQTDQHKWWELLTNGYQFKMRGVTAPQIEACPLFGWGHKAHLQCLSASAYCTHRAPSQSEKTQHSQTITKTKIYLIGFFRT